MVPSMPPQQAGVDLFEQTRYRNEFKHKHKLLPNEQIQ